MTPKFSTISSVPDFYRGANILITGSTGFLGLVLVEKLLSSCPDLNKIYAIVRPKRGKSVQERKIIFSESELFVNLLAKNPQILDKLELIEGDMSLPRLGLSDTDWEKLKCVSIFFHSAASVRFDEPLKEAILGHVRGTRELLELASSCKNIKAFVHVSTAYCNMHNGSLEEIKELRVQEKLYPDIDDWKNVIKLAENLDKELLQHLTQHFTKFSLNNYLYTKALSENVSKAYQDKIPIVMYRPSIVIAKAIGPMRGWINNLNGPYGISVAVLLGLCRVVYGNPSVAWDVVPVDVTINGMIISAAKRHLVDDTTVVYNCSFEKTSSLDVINSSKYFAHLLPFSDMIWCQSVDITQCKVNYRLKCILLHLLPAYLIDTFLVFSGKKPRLQKVQRKIKAAMEAIHYFITHTFEICNFNYMNLSNFVNDADKKTFDIRIMEEKKNRPDFNKNAIVHIRKYLLKDPDETLPAARKKFQRIKFADKTIKAAFWSACVYFYCMWLANL
ncbi:putative fatty acyl-CoA reductase CG5065 [Culicoides brevitarsis]|uniref:putative fatty acyl-CoA reductase CG5065 n=1 Tax=Culicoides brevitarsis TaxID=469753 RepID=UPI00307C1427